MYINVGMANREKNTFNGAAIFFLCHPTYGIATTVLNDICFQIGTEHCLSLPVAIPSIMNPLVFTRGSSSSTLTCISTGSVATTVTFVRDGTTVGPLRDGESLTFSGVTYQITQMVTNRTQSSYQNVLTINQPLADIIGSTFSCIVENTIGASPDSQSLTIIMSKLLLFEQWEPSMCLACWHCMEQGGLAVRHAFKLLVYPN